LTLSIIILNYNAGDLIIQCLKSLAHLIQKPPFATEILVIDNNSWDGSMVKVKAEIPWVKLIVNQKNLGFAKAYNQGIRLAKGEYILLLNPDTIIPEGTIEEMVKFMAANPKVGVSTCRVELTNGELDWACHRGFATPWVAFTYFAGLERLFPKSRWFGRYHLTWLPLDQPHEIDTPNGCFYLVRRKVIEPVGLLDEDYFLYSEDNDWSYRIKEAGWKIFYYPKVKIIHHKGISSGIKTKTSEISSARKEDRLLAINSFYDSMWLFYRKHLYSNYPFLINRLVYLGIWLKRKISLLTKHV